MFVAFCLGASGTYFWNDVLDVEADRAHPTKSAGRSRPGR
jgi:decaprenyl-phosphate phosphoribosyltransferase